MCPLPDSPQLLHAGRRDFTIRPLTLRAGRDQMRDHAAVSAGRRGSFPGRHHRRAGRRAYAPTALRWVDRHSILRGGGHHRVGRPDARNPPSAMRPNADGEPAARVGDRGREHDPKPWRARSRMRPRTSAWLPKSSARGGSSSTRIGVSLRAAHGRSGASWRGRRKGGCNPAPQGSGDAEPGKLLGARRSSAAPGWKTA